MTRFRQFAYAKLVVTALVPYLNFAFRLYAFYVTTPTLSGYYGVGGLFSSFAVTENESP